MLKTRTRFHHKDQAMSKVDPQSDLVGKNNTKPIINPLSLSFLIGLNNKKCISDSDFVLSPKSPLEFMMLSTITQPFFFKSPTAHFNSSSGPAKVGLSIVDSLENDPVFPRDVVFGPALRIKCSKTNEKHHIKIEQERSGVVFEIGKNSYESEPVGIGSDMEMSEDYTCVITHGANSKTTHIYGDRVLKCHKNELKEEDDDKEKFIDSGFSPYNFRNICNFCNKKLEVGQDIYMYRERGFCSGECRSEAMKIYDDDHEDSFLHES